MHEGEVVGRQLLVFVAPVHEEEFVSWHVGVFIVLVHEGELHARHEEELHVRHLLSFVMPAHQGECVSRHVGVFIVRVHGAPSPRRQSSTRGAFDPRRTAAQGCGARWPWLLRRGGASDRGEGGIRTLDSRLPDASGRRYLGRYPILLFLVLADNIFS